MSRLLYSATMSLDGFIAGPGGDMSWLGDHLGSVDVDVSELMSQVGSLLIGHRTFTGDDPNRGTDSEGAFGGAWSGPSIVLSHQKPAETDPMVRFAADLETAVRLAQEAAGEKYVNVLGADVARQCVEAGLLDEVLVFMVPVLLGDGTRLFDRPGGTRVLLEPLDRADPTLWFRVSR